MSAFILCRDLHKSTMNKMRTKARQRQYELDGDFLAYMNFEPEPCLYVDGLCSKERGIGKSLMSLLDTIVAKSKKYEAVKLAALTYVVKYYYNQGFRFTNSPNNSFKKNILSSRRNVNLRCYINCTRKIRHTENKNRGHNYVK